MENNTEGKLLRIFISNTDKFKHKPLYEVIVNEAKRYGLAGTTVLRGTMGFTPGGKIGSAKLVELVEKLPLVVEIIDEPEKIDTFFETIQPYFKKIQGGCIVTMEKVSVLLYKTKDKKDILK